MSCKSLSSPPNLDCGQNHVTPQASTRRWTTGQGPFWRAATIYPWYTAMHWLPTPTVKIPLCKRADFLRNRRCKTRTALRSRSLQMQRPLFASPHTRKSRGPHMNLAGCRTKKNFKSHRVELNEMCRMEIATLRRGDGITMRQNIFLLLSVKGMANLSLCFAKRRLMH